jgi:hypothetical protein
MTQVFIRQNLFQRWIVVTAENIDGELAWSGSQWVSFDGDVQISNLDTWEEAAAYAESFGFTVIGRLE